MYVCIVYLCAFVWFSTGACGNILVLLAPISPDIYADKVPCCVTDWVREQGEGPEKEQERGGGKENRIEGGRDTCI